MSLRGNAGLCKIYCRGNESWTTPVWYFTRNNFNYQPNRVDSYSYANALLILASWNIVYSINIIVSEAETPKILAGIATSLPQESRNRHTPCFRSYNRLARQWFHLLIHEGVISELNIIENDNNVHRESLVIFSQSRSTGPGILYEARVTHTFKPY